MQIVDDWAADAAKTLLVGRYPGPLAVVAANGAVDFVNEPFTRLFDPACLADRSIRAIAEAADGTHHGIHLRERNGALTVIDLQAIAFDGSTILLFGAPDADDVVFDAPGGEELANELEVLRARIRELEVSSATDRLTGAWNRAHLDAVLVSEIARSVRYHQPLSLILVDIDHFKRVNDTHGHLVGDAVLRELTEQMHLGMRAADLLFRWGGEEFVVLATSSGYRAAYTLGENLRERIEGHVFPVVGKVTISVGVAEHTGTEGADNWFRRVDDALYAAKADGRNCLRVDQQGNSDTWAAEVVGALHLTWAEAYSSGNATIDHQHHALFDMANAVIDAAARASDGTEGLAESLEELAMHLAQHFVDEEALLAERAYQHLDRHRSLHAALQARLDELRLEAAQGHCGFGDLVDFVANTVVMRHMLTADRLFFHLFDDQTVGV